MLMRVIRVLGKFLISVGIGVLLFVVWTLWGTGLATQRAQAQLSKEYARLPAVKPVTDGRSTGPPRSFKPAPGDPVFKLTIPRLDLEDVAVVEGVTTDQLAQGPGHYPECRDGFAKPLCTEGGEVWPGEVGRTIVSAHRTTHGHEFWGLDKMQEGDEIEFDTKWGQFTYEVITTRVVPANSMEIANPASKKAEVALTTCNPKFSATERLVVFAELVEH